MTATPPTDPRPAGDSPLRAALRPLLQRLRLGEGGLFGMAVWTAAWQSRDAGTVLAVAAVALVLLAALYLYNDVIDRVVDAHNPKKLNEQRLALLARPHFFLAAALAAQVAAAAAAWWLLGAVAGAAAASLLLLNPFYSAVAKRVPGLDVVVVGAMGAALVALATAAPALLLLAAAMTGISHAFQTSVDRDADLAAGIRSSGTAPEPLRALIWLALTATLALAAYPTLGVAGSATAIVPLALARLGGDAGRGWAWARAYFGLLWLAATLA